MNQQQHAELTFWRNIYRTFPNYDAWLENRRRDLANYAEYIPEIYRESGAGLDLACGMTSVLEFLPETSTAKITAVDALWNSYRELGLPSETNRVRYFHGDGERLDFEDHAFDFIWCINTIDHTPNPEKMLQEMFRVLRTGGRFYFWVNFDQPPLADAHYELWDQDMVKVMTRRFKLLRGTTFWSATWKKYVFSGLFQK